MQSTQQNVGLATITAEPFQSSLSTSFPSSSSGLSISRRGSHERGQNDIHATTSSSASSSSFSPSPSSPSSSSSYRKHMLLSASSFQRHPLLVGSISSTNAQRDLPSGIDRQVHSLSGSKQSSPSSSTLSASSQMSMTASSFADRQHLSPLQAAAARRASDESHVRALDDDDEEDADDVEANLRYPSFARRPSDVHTRTRRPSPLRNTAFVDAPSAMVSISALDSGERQEQHSSRDRNESIGDQGEESFDVFPFDELDSQNHPDLATRAVWQDDEDDEDDEVSYGDLASPLFSIPPSLGSHTTRRTSDHSSASDLDMIWDEEDEERSFENGAKLARRFPSGMASTAAVTEQRRSSSAQRRAPLPASAPAVECGTYAANVMPTALPFARRSDHTAVPHPNMHSLNCIGAHAGRRASNTIAERSNNSDAVDFRRHSAAIPFRWQSNAGRKRSGTDPVRRSHVRSATTHDVVNVRQSRSASASPRRRSQLDERFAELLETIRI